MRLIPSVESESTAKRRPVSNLKLLGTILRLKGMQVTAFTFQDHDRQLHLSVKPYKNGCRCPQCNAEDASSRVAARVAAGRI